MTPPTVPTPPTRFPRWITQPWPRTRTVVVIGILAVLTGSVIGVWWFSTVSTLLAWSALAVSAGDGVPLALDDPHRDVHVVDPEALGEDVLEGVAEGAVAEVVEQARGHEQAALLLGEPHRLGDLPCDVRHAEAVLDARVVRAGEDEVGEPELADPVQALELQALQEVEDEGVQAEGPVDRVVDRLELRHGGGMGKPPV